jgi:MOSC domain-containing protein YiiM
VGHIESVNVGVSKPYAAKTGRSGIDKYGVAGPVRVEAPEPTRAGLAGDTIVDVRGHGGPDQAVYAFAREEIDDWAERLDRPIRNGFFGENLTTVGVEVDDAVIGETWQVGDELLLQVTLPRLPCVTFADQMQRPGWVAEFTRHARVGAYLRVLRPGEVRAGDRVTVVDRPDSPLTVAVSFRAVTLEPELLPLVASAPVELPAKLARRVAGRVPTG